MTLLEQFEAYLVEAGFRPGDRLRESWSLHSVSAFRAAPSAKSSST